MSARRKAFLAFSAELTGYSEADLEGTGLVDDYQALFEHQAGPAVTTQLHATLRRVLRHRPGPARDEAMRLDILASPILWGLSSALIVLWYQGSWTSPSAWWYALSGTTVPHGVTPGRTFVPSADAYTQQLAYRGAGAHPPGANPTGFGSWSIPPVFGDRQPGTEGAS